jgi:pimeloyl-ACP methyl ester carboxylesterase
VKLPTLISLVLLVITSGVSCAVNPATQSATDPLESLESQTLYHPRSYDAGDVDGFLHDGGIQLDYKTSQGKQSAWLVIPAHGVKPERLWIVAGGNGALALDMVPICQASGLKKDAFVFVDYPGYGLCEGKCSPESVRENVKGSMQTAAAKTGIDVQHKPQLVSALGHSLGCAAALFAVEEFHLKSAVLCSPFTSSKEMAELRVGLSKDAPFRHQFDNRIGLQSLKGDKGHAWIIHGSDDEIIPVEMSKTMAAEFPGVVKLQVIKDAHHNDIFIVGSKEIMKAMAEARVAD